MHASLALHALTKQVCRFSTKNVHVLWKISNFGNNIMIFVSTSKDPYYTSSRFLCTFFLKLSYGFALSYERKKNLWKSKKKHPGVDMKTRNQKMTQCCRNSLKSPSSII